MPENANRIFLRAEKKEVKLLLPSIALGESLYTIYKGKKIFGNQIPIEKIDLIFQILAHSDLIKLISLDIDSWQIFHQNYVPELHDRMITAHAIYNSADAIITSDSEIAEVFPTIW